jgi:hypothetical protein
MSGMSQRLTMVGFSAGMLALQACVPHLETKGGQTEPSDWVRPENTWSSGEETGPPACLTAEGCAEGETPPDVRLPDQHGDMVSLWQFYGLVVLLDISTGWCLPCQDLGAVTQATQDDFGDQGFVYLTVLQQDADGAPPDVDDALGWAEFFGIETAPVTADAGDPPATEEATAGHPFPMLITIDRAMKVHELVNGTDEATVRAAIEAAL